MHLPLIKGIFLFAAYLSSARLGLSLSSVSDFATLIWLPTGISFAALFLWGRSYWPAIILGSLATNLLTGAPAMAAIFMAMGNTLEAVVGVTLFRKFSLPDSRLERVRDVVALVSAALLSTIISAVIGVGALYASGIVSGQTFGETWRTWWIGDLLSDFVIAPFIIIWSRAPRFSMSTSRKIEGFVMGAILVTLSVFIFSDWPSPGLSKYLRPFWIFLLLIWATLRFGQKTNVLLTLVLAGIATTFTVLGQGPYQEESVSDSLLLLQMFTGAVALSGLFFGALGREKEEALRMRTDFISIASHELRTPITGLNLSLDLLKGYEASNPSQEVHRTIQALDRQSKKLTSLVNSLLNVAQIESGNLVLEKKETDVSTLVKDVSDGLGDLLERTSCKLQLNIQPMVKSVCSSYGLEQVLTNLMMNSMKYGAGKEVSISLGVHGDKVRLSVKDEGSGIAPEEQRKIFDRFHRASSKNVQGLGLGLYISKLIVEAHQGNISVKSEPGKGATFIVEIPVT